MTDLKFGITIGRGASVGARVTRTHTRTSVPVPLSTIHTQLRSRSAPGYTGDAGLPHPRRR